MKTFGILLVCVIGIFLLTKEQPKPDVVKVNNQIGEQRCIAPNSTNNHSEAHNACCISSGRAAYILNQNSELN